VQSSQNKDLKLENLVYIIKWIIFHTQYYGLGTCVK
jgi:hypothetical protein